MDFQRQMHKINQGEHASVYAIHGTEYYLKQQFFANLLPKQENLDFQTFNLEEHSIHEVLDEANAFSFFAEQRYIIVENANFLQSQSKVKLSKEGEKQLIEYLTSPNLTTVLIFDLGGDPIDKRKKITKKFQTSTEFINIQTVEAKMVERYVKDYLHNSKLNVSKEAMRELLERVNYQLTAAMSEVSKLEVYALTHQHVGIETVRKLVPRTLESNVFELTNAVMNKNVERAIQIYEDLLLLKNEPIALHALLVSQFRLMLQVIILRSQGIMEGQIVEMLKVHPYRVKLALKSAIQMNIGTLKALYLELVSMDYKMKTGVGHRESYFYFLLMKFV